MIVESDVLIYSRKGRVDCVVQSTDKNFMVPVGGAVVGGSKSMMREWSEQYPGVSPHVQYSLFLIYQAEPPLLQL